MKRDGLTEYDVLQRIQNQITDQERKQKGSYFIINDEVNPVIPQVLKIQKQVRIKVESKKFFSLPIGMASGLEPYHLRPSMMHSIFIRLFFHPKALNTF